MAVAGAAGTGTGILNGVTTGVKTRSNVISKGMIDDVPLGKSAVTLSTLGRSGSRIGNRADADMATGGAVTGFAADNVTGGADTICGSHFKSFTIGVVTSRSAGINGMAALVGMGARQPIGNRRTGGVTGGTVNKTNHLTLWQLEISTVDTVDTIDTIDTIDAADTGDAVTTVVA